MGEERNSGRIPRVLESLDVLEPYPHVFLDNVNLGSLSLFARIILGVLPVFEDSHESGRESSSLPTREAG